MQIQNMWFEGLQLFIAILLEYNITQTRNTAMIETSSLE